MRFIFIRYVDRYLKAKKKIKRSKDNVHHIKIVNGIDKSVRHVNLIQREN